MFEIDDRTVFVQKMFSMHSLNGNDY